MDTPQSETVSSSPINSDTTPIQPNTKKKSIVIFIFIIVGILVCLLIGITGFIFAFQKSQSNQPVACTMEAKICPDGSAVGRGEPNCEFSPCPNE